MRLGRLPRAVALGVDQLLTLLVAAVLAARRDLGAQALQVLLPTEGRANRWVAVGWEWAGRSVGVAGCWQRVGGMGLRARGWRLGLPPALAGFRKDELRLLADHFSSHLVQS